MLLNTVYTRVLIHPLLVYLYVLVILNHSHKDATYLSSHLSNIQNIGQWGIDTEIKKNMSLTVCTITSLPYKLTLTLFQQHSS